MLLRTDTSILRIPSSFMRYYVRSFGSLRSIACPTVRPFISSFHSAKILARKRDKFSFSSKAPVIPQKDTVQSEEQPRKPKRKTRSSAAKNSLRRVAVEAQRSRNVKEPIKITPAAHQTTPKVKGLPPLEAIKANQCSIIDSDGNLRRGGV